MTSKEALEDIRNILYENLEFHQDVDELIRPIIKDLERLEELNEVWHKNEPMESYDINANHLQEIYDFITHLVEENIELRKKIENIKKLPNCCICDENWHKGCMCLQRKIKEVLGNE